MWSIIDYGLKDFLRDESDEPWMFNTFDKAEEWLLTYGTDFGWTETSVRYFNWEQE